MPYILELWCVCEMVDYEIHEIVDYEIDEIVEYDP